MPPRFYITILPCLETLLWGSNNLGRQPEFQTCVVLRRLRSSTADRLMATDTFGLTATTEVVCCLDTHCLSRR